MILRYRESVHSSMRKLVKPGTWGESYIGLSVVRLNANRAAVSACWETCFCIIYIIVHVNSIYDTSKSDIHPGSI